jgi:hypothetical protein
MKDSEFLKVNKSDAGFMIVLSVLFAITLGYYFGTQLNFETKVTSHKTTS